MSESNKVKNLIVINNLTLESTESTTQSDISRSVIDSYYSNTLNITTNYLTGATEVATKCYIKIW